MERIKNHPLRTEDEGLNRYYGDVAYLNLRR
jgi:hypothetical protein